MFTITQNRLHTIVSILSLRLILGIINVEIIYQYHTKSILYVIIFIITYKIAPK